MPDVDGDISVVTIAFEVEGDDDIFDAGDEDPEERIEADPDGDVTFCLLFSLQCLWRTQPVP